MARSIDEALATEREAVRRDAAGGVDAGSVTVGAGGAPRAGGPGAQPRDARTDAVRSRDPQAFGRPTGREEEWRFTPLARLRGLLDGAPADGKLTVEVDADPQVEVVPLAPDDPLVGSVLVPADRVAATAMASFAEGTLVRVPARAVARRPTTLTLRGDGGTAYSHVVVDVGAQAEAVVVLDHVGSATYAGNVEVRVGDGAHLTLVSLQNWADDAVHCGAHAVRLGRDARLTSGVVTFGGDLVRLTPTVDYRGPGGDAELLGLYFADAGQHLEHRLLVDHAVADCRSRVTYKGALQGDEAHAVWVGDVLIQAPATGTDTYEVNRNLLLTDGARADSVPNLEIETGEIVGAGHASATGRFDEEQVFYLMSRGVPRAEATRLVVRGFFAEVVEQLGVPELAERLLAAIDAELAEEAVGVAT